jgi:rubrerythrin
MGFDLARYQEASGRLDLTGIEWEAAPRMPLEPAALEALIYMMDVEGHTSIYLSELLVSKACMDPEITGFLHVWAYEEMFHSLALARFLNAYGVEIAADHQARLRARTDVATMRTTLSIMLASRVLDSFAALYLTIGAINELSTLWGYQLLAQRTQHPVLQELLARIVKQERKHYAYYRWQARRRLSRSAIARALTRRYLDRRFVAVGYGVKSLAEVHSLARYLLCGPDGMHAARSIDQEIARLPGMRGAFLAQRTRQRALAR